MRRCLLLMLFSVLIVSGLSAWSDVSSYGGIEDIATNPASIAKRERRAAGFMVGLDYRDSFEDGIFSDVDSFSYANEPANNIFATFVGGNLSFTANMGIYLDDKYTSSDGSTYYDFNNTTTFSFDMAWEYDQFSLGASISGGNLATRLNRKVERPFDLVGNALFAEYEPESGMENFQLGVGGLYTEGPYSVGILFSRLLYLEDDELTSSDSEVLDNLSFGASMIFSKYTDYGDLRLVRPRLFVEFGDVGSESATLTLGLTSNLQFLPKNEMSITFAYVRLSDGGSNYFDSYETYHLLELTYLLGSFKFGLLLDDMADRLGLSLFLRYIA
ncbi:MAG: hypothetical protein IJ831_09120 [Spirochaetales bacterium]|nr:hypothetical protein [Spirochaetales bacterium]